MRVVLVEHNGHRVCGNSAAFAAQSAEWAAISDSVASPEEKAIAAAKLLDESQGRPVWRYEFTTFGPDHCDGYDVFFCPSPQDAEDVSTVVCCCQYVGCVCRHPSSEARRFTIGDSAN
jgi:hypothetical protein